MLLLVDKEIVGFHVSQANSQCGYRIGFDTKEGANAPQLVLVYTTAVGYLKVVYKFGDNPEVELDSWTLNNTDYPDEPQTWTGNIVGDNGESLQIKVYVKFTGIGATVYLRNFYAQLNVLAYRRDLL